VSIRIVDGKKIVKCYLNFFIFYFSSHRGIATCIALHAFRRLRRQYCSRRSNSDIYTLLLNFLNISSVFRGKGLFHVTGTCEHLCYIF
jgi:hypothetical protein